MGRDEVLERLRDALDATATEGRVIALAGEAGLGKTRLSRAIADRARALGRVVIEGRASPMEATLPLGVVQDALRSERRASPVDPIPDDPLAAAFPELLLPELTGASRPEVDRGVLFEAATRYLRARARSAGLVFVLEDLHWADPTSHALIGQLARTTRDAPILLVLTYRPEEPGSPSLHELRHELARERLSQELVLVPLGDDDVAFMLGDILGVDADPTLLRLIADASGGNPFVVEELVRHAVENGRIDLDEGRWRLDESLELPSTVQEMVLRRVRTLRPGDQEFLRWAAVLGERFDPALVTVLNEVTEQATFEAFGRLHDAGLVTDTREVGDGRLAFRHALTREAVLGELLAPDRRRRHARVLDAARGSASEGPPLRLEELLEHALGAGDRILSLTYSIRAAGRSADLGGYQEARLQYERALDLWRPADGLDLRADLYLRLGYLESIGGGLVACVIDPRSRAHFEEARRLYEEIGDTNSAALARAGVAWSGKTFDVVEDLRSARKGISPDAAPEAACQILGCLAEREFLLGDTRAALRTCAEGLALLAAHPGPGDPGYVARPWQLRRSFLLTSALATWWLGDRAAGEASMLTLADEAVGRNDYVGAVLAYQALSRATLDWPAESLRYAENGLELTRGDETPTMAVWLTHLMAQAQVHQGNWDAADALLDRAEAVVDPDQPYLKPALAMVRGELVLGRGELRRAVTILEPLSREVDEVSGRIFKRVVRCALARAQLGEGELAAARNSVAPLVAGWHRDDEGPFMHSALLPIVLVELACADGDVGAVLHWSNELSTLGSGPRADYARALTALTAGPPPGPRSIETAARAIGRSGRRWEAAWMRFAGAGAASRAGDLDQAADLASAALQDFRGMAAEGWSRRAEALLRGLGRRVPSRQSGRGAGGLTRRELEVLGLVAAGASNQQIAERLFISRPTAIRHVANIFAKLDARNRAEAVRIAGERGLLEGSVPLS